MRSKLIAIIGAVLIALAVAGPADANRSAEPVGERLGLFAYLEGPGSFPADTPFHVRHGWISPVGQERHHTAWGSYDFTLALDGTLLEPDAVVMEFDQDHPVWGRSISKMSLFNFPDGLRGSHTLTGTWYGACGELVDQGVYEAPCAHPKAKVVSLIIEARIEFGAP